MSELHSLPSSSLAWIFAAYMAVLGLICGMVYAIGGMAYDLSQGGANAGTALALLAVLGMPAIAAVVGLALGYVLARPASWLLGRFGKGG